MSAYPVGVCVLCHFMTSSPLLDVVLALGKETGFTQELNVSRPVLRSLALRSVLGLHVNTGVGCDLSHSGIHLKLVAFASRIRHSSENKTKCKFPSDSRNSFY